MMQLRRRYTNRWNRNNNLDGVSSDCFTVFYVSNPWGFVFLVSSFCSLFLCSLKLPYLQLVPILLKKWPLLKRKAILFTRALRCYQCPLIETCGLIASWRRTRFELQLASRTLELSSVMKVMSRLTRHPLEIITKVTVSSSIILAKDVSGEGKSYMVSHSFRVEISEH